MAGLAPYVLDHLVGGVFRRLGLLRHLDLLIDKKNRNSSLIQILKSVPKVLTSDTAGLGKDVMPYTQRHTWVTWFYAQTKDFRRLVDLGGWNKADTATRYCIVAPKDFGNRLLQQGWDFREDVGGPVQFGELVTVKK